MKQIDLNKNRILIKDVFNSKKLKVEIAGWVHKIRGLGKINFIVLRDISGIIQITAVKGKVSDELFNLMDKITRESVIYVKGTIKDSKQAPRGKEIIPDEIEIISKAEDLPIDVSDFSKTELPKRLDWRCLSLRTRKSQIIFKIQSKLIEGMQEWLHKNGFSQVFTPCLMGVASESGSEVFEVKYFKDKAFLRQDPQLHRQLTILGGLERIYDIGASWRAEKSHTVRHLCEHRTCAVELAFIDSEKDVMKIEEQVIISAFKKVNQDCKKELEELEIKLNIPQTNFPEITFPEVYSILEKMGIKIKEGEDLDLEAEKLLWKYVQKQYPGVDFYFLNKFPFKKKPFYVMGEDNSRYARSTDLYYRGIEMSSGGQRENRYDSLMKNIKDRKVNPKSVEWFTKFFKYGVPTHGGFAIGIERLTMVLLELPNVREAVLFPRDTERLLP
ncbi:MAG: aspartate--tRNA(Asn) ligase [Nanoarchaeota archaeon]|nr:aspartate--tRNA(Asn) ligase [Nanoarchaeota archaeon]MBU4116442.1 aspartate--tRNA(Asn) ligase [Nanoarchaeota archaeon]